MFKNRALEVRVKKTDNNAASNPTVETLDLDKLNEVAKEQIQHVATIVGVLYLGKKATDTFAELILIAGRRYL